MYEDDREEAEEDRRERFGGCWIGATAGRTGLWRIPGGVMAMRGKCLLDIDGDLYNGGNCVSLAQSLNARVRGGNLLDDPGRMGVASADVVVNGFLWFRYCSKSALVEVPPTSSCQDRGGCLKRLRARTSMRRDHRRMSGRVSGRWAGKE